jgi:hypothetical protein
MKKTLLEHTELRSVAEDDSTPTTPNASPSSAPGNRARLEALV